MAVATRDLLLSLVRALQEPLAKIGATEFEERKDEFGQHLVAGLPNGLQVEVFFTPARAPYDSEYSRRVTMPIEGVPVPFLSPEDLACASS